MKTLTHASLLEVNRAIRRDAYRDMAICHSLASATCQSAGLHADAAYHAGMAALAMECEDRAAHASLADLG